EFITAIRRHVLDDWAAQGNRFTPQERVLLAAHLAHYAFHGNYILDETPDETRQIEALIRRIETETNAAGAAAIAILACYRPWDVLTAASAILERFRTVKPLDSVVKLQIADDLALRATMASIASAPAIGEGVSSDVRRQYEDFPYPLWSVPEKAILLQ